MKPTRFRALRALSSTALISAAALALIAFAPACKKSTESNDDEAALRRFAAQQKAAAAAKVTPVAGNKTPETTPGEAPAAAPAKVPDLGVSKTLKGTANVAIAAPGTEAAPAKAAPTKAVPTRAAPAVEKTVTASKGVKKETATHIVQVHPPTSASSGTQGVVKVTLLPKPGWKINMDFPTSLRVSAPSGVTVEKGKLRKGDAASFAKERAEFHVKFNAAGAGSKAFTAKFKFAMCTEETCDPKKEILAWSVDVK